MSGAGGGTTGLALSWAIERKARVSNGMNGALAGLVAVTTSCDLVEVREALAIGAVGGCIAVFGGRLLEGVRVDDVVGAVPVHFMAGLRGMIAVAVSGSDTLGVPFLQQLAAQSAGIAALAGLAVALPLAAFAAIDRVLPLRVIQHVETISLNVGEHGANPDLNELFEIMQRQARERDVSIRAPQSAFTEVGRIGLFYNSVLFELERSFHRIASQKNDLADATDQKNALPENILPKQIAARMNGGADQIVDRVTDATVLFVDIVDFAEYTASVSPEESLGLLRDLFKRFDAVVGTFDLEKIKTVGDSYMFVAGVASDVPGHCAITVEAAIDVLFETRQVSQQIGRSLQVRVRIPSGPLGAGILGELRFVHDL